MIESETFEKSMYTSKYRNKYIPEDHFVSNMLEKILGSKSKIRILRSIFKNPKRSYSMENIVKATGMSYGTVHPAMQELVESRIIVTQKIGRSIAYKINQNHVLFPKIMKIIANFKKSNQKELKTRFNFNSGWSNRYINDGKNTKTDGRTPQFGYCCICDDWRYYISWN